MFSIVSQLFKFIRVYRKFWLVPLLVGLLMIGGLLVLTQGTAITPFIYALF